MGSPQGWASIPRWLLYSDKITPAAKLTYTVVQGHVDEYGKAWPSLNTIATKSGLSKSSVQRALRELTKAGLVQAEERRRKDGGQAANVYTIATAKPVDNPGDN